MTRTLTYALTALLAVSLHIGSALTAAATSRIKGLVSTEGVRRNQLIGCGLVVGLNGPAIAQQHPLHQAVLQAMLERLGVGIVAPPSHRQRHARHGHRKLDLGTQGTHIDVISRSRRFKSLMGGTLLVTHSSARRHGAILNVSSSAGFLPKGMPPR
jgi:flagellar P-ring protein precursor FlgI